MATIKHIIFKGKERTGKSLFANIIFDRAKTLWIEGRSFDINNPFPFESGREKWDYEYVVIDDLHCRFNIESVFPVIFSDVLVINRLNRELEHVKMPTFIFITDSSYNSLPVEQSFRRRFKVIDFDKNTIADLTKLIEDEKIIINNHR